MELKEVMAELESMGSEQTKKTFTNHGCTAPFFGVKVGDMKKVLKHIKKDQALAHELYNTGNADAQYLAGLSADPKQFSKEELENWALSATWHMVSEYSVAWNVSESEHCLELCEKWIHSDNTVLQQTGWASLGSYLLYEKRPEIDQAYFRKLIDYVVENIHQSENRVRYTMNGFLIALGGAEEDFYSECVEATKKIGKVEVFMGKTACKVPFGPDYLKKMKDMGRIGKKKKTMKC